jgi:hypothetical protein
MRTSTALLLLGIEHTLVAALLLIVPAVTWRPVLLLAALAIAGTGIGCAVAGLALSGRHAEPLIDRVGAADD